MWTVEPINARSMLEAASAAAICITAAGQPPSNAAAPDAGRLAVTNQKVRPPIRRS
jgi:hypothetical protein